MRRRIRKPAKAGHYGACRLTAQRAAERIQIMGSSKRLGILVGGGPAPGINAVISAATIAGAQPGIRGHRHPRRLQAPGPPRPIRAPPARHRRRVARAPARRIDARDLAREPDQVRRGDPRRDRDAAAGRHHPSRHDRRRRYGALVALRQRAARTAPSAACTCRRRSTTICRCRRTCPPSVSRPRGTSASSSYAT